VGVDGAAPTQRGEEVTDKAFKKALDKALTALGRPDALLVRQHGNGDRATRFEVWLPHESFRVRDDVADDLLMREDVQPFDSGLPGLGGPQSWKRGKPGAWRTWKR
jgi:hypothetical protein